MAAPHNVEFEAAKFLQKLIHESTDEPAKLATKLYVILQHMKASGKENSMPYQVISRAMETVINQHGLDIEALTSSRLPLSTGPQGESASAHMAACSQTLPSADSKSGMAENDSNRTEGFASCRPPSAPNSLGNDHFQGSASQRSGKSFDRESPSSIDTKSTNSQSQDRRETASWEQQGAQKNSNKPSIKRKRSDSSAVEPPDDSIQQMDSHNAVPDLRKERLTGKVEMPGNFPGVSDGWKQGFSGATSFRDTGVPGQIFSPNQAGVSMANFNSASRIDAAGIQVNADRLLQAANPSNLSEVGAVRTSTSRDTGKAPAIPASVTNLPFKEHHLKQLRAQCLVFLAFRNGLAPKRLHLEIALGNIFMKEGIAGSVDGAQNEQISDKGKQPTTLESSCTAEVALQRLNSVNVKNERVVIGAAAAGFVPEASAVVNEPETVRTAGAKMGLLANQSLADAGKNISGGGTFEDEMQRQEMSNSSVLLTTGLHLDRSGMISPAVHSFEGNLQPDGTNHRDYGMCVNKQPKPEMTRWTVAAQNDIPQNALHPSIPHEFGNRNDGSSNLPQHEGDNLTLQRADSHLSTCKTIQGTEDVNGALDKTRSVADVSRMVPGFDSSYSYRSPSPHGSEPEEEDKSVSVGLASSPKYTLSEKWIIAHQKRKVVNQQKWAHKLQKADQRIACCFNELKETVSSSEDISSKTRSVIELKKLQLLQLQRCLRRNIMNDFFKPVRAELDQLKSIKRHRIGRRLKHVEKFEQKMKEERQKRIRERQKEFFSEIEVHREKLEDVFKFKRERCKGINRYVKEFHKRKERIHREKIDRIQREKINLLKINDVEGYLRMVQDAKCDRVNKLLKETEKYLQKLGSRLQEAKSSSREDMDENRVATCDVGSENAAEMEDENDQAKHYKESNEKYYLIAHSIKESITEQPSGIQGGKLREYQMNGLRWLVSLYNNHLNGILADEMGLGKTVQVISLLCYLMEAKNDRGPFLVVVPSSVLPGWERELSFWAPGINKIVYAGPPEERRRLFKDCIVHQKFNVLLTTYEYLMNKHDRPKLSKIHWHYVIIDEGHRIKNASCKLNAELKHYRSSHRLLLTGTPLQNSLEELWALLNFLLPNIFNSSEDFSQWFNKPFEGNGDNTLDEALLSEEENLLIINRLHQVLRPFVLRRLKHKVENELPEKIERLVRCEASAYQKLLMKRVEENLGSLGMTKGRAIHNTVMELRNICNHPYLSQLHVEEVENLIPKHFLPPIIRFCGKLEMLDRLLPKLKETNHRVLFFSTMTRLLDIMEDYLVWKKYLYLRLDGHTSGQDRGALIEKFNQPDSPYFIFLLSIRAGGVGVNLQAADTVIIFDTDWNPQVDLQAQARAHRIGQKKDVLVLRLETVKSVEEQVRAAAEHKLGVANQSITAGFFDNNTSAEDRREYLESLLRESKKEEAAPVLDDDSLNDILARSESEIEVFEAIDHRRREEEMATWESIVLEHECVGSEASSSFPSRLVTENDLKAFYEAMKVYETSGDGPASSSGAKRKGGYTGGFDSQQYGRGKRAREVRSYEEHWSEEEFEKMCQSGSPETLRLKDEKFNVAPPSECGQTAGEVERPLEGLQTPPPSMGSSSLLGKEVSPHVRRGRGRPKRTQMDISPSVGISSTPSAIGISNSDSQPQQLSVSAATEASHGVDDAVSPMSKVVPPALAGAQSAQGFSSAAAQPKRQGRKGKICQNSIRGEQGIETVRRRGRNPKPVEQPSSDTSRSMNASIKVTQDNSPADGPRSLLPKGSEGSDILTLGDAEALDLTANRTSLDASLKAASPTPGTLVEGSVKQAVLNSSAVGSPPPEPQQVNKGDMVPPGKIRSIAKSSAVSNSLTIDKGTHIDSTPPTASSSELQPSLTPLRAGRRQSQKSTNATEPVRRRGRKRGASASADLTPPIVQSLKSPELFKNTGSTSARFQAQGQDQRDKSAETVPRRRGRKKGAVLLAGPDHSVGQYSLATRSRQPDGEDGQLPERKVIATRSRQVSRSVVPAPCIEESSSAKAVSIGKPLETRHTSAVEETNQYGRPADFPPISSKGRTNVIVLALDATSCSVHPIGLRDRNMREKKEFSELQMESALNASMLKPEDSRLDISPATGIEAAKLDEELSAPPGFETPRACVSTVNKPEERNECKTSKSPDVKMGSVVLALESASQSIDPSIRCQNVSENEDTSKVHTIRDSEQGTVVPAVPEGHVLNLEAATDKVTSCQPDEDMLAPPGFAIPQQCLSETDTAKILESDNLLPSDVLADSAIKVKEDVICRGPSGDKETNDSCNSLTASTGVGSGTIDASTVESKDEELCQGSDDAAALTSQLNKEFKSSGPESADVRHPTSDDAPLAAKVLTLELKGEHVGPQNTAASPLEPKDEESHGPDNGNAELSAHDKLPASVVPIHESAEVPALDSGPRNTKDVIVDAFNPSVAGPLTAETSVLTPKEQGETHGPDAGNTEFGTHDIPTASMVPNSASVELPAMAPKVDEEACGPINSVQDIVDASIASVAGLNESASVLEPTEKKESHGTDDGNNDFITPNIPTASMVPNSDLAKVLHVTPHVEGESCGPDNTEQGIVDASIASVACPLNEPASALEPIEQKESHGTDDGNNDLITPNIPTASVVPNSDLAEILPMAPQVEGEACGPDNTEQDLVASLVSVPCPLNEPASALEPIEQKESHGTDDGNNDLITPNIPTASVVPISDSAEVLPLAPPVEGEACGPDNTEQDIVDASIASVACPLNKQASSLELIEQKECHGTVDGNTDLTTHDIHTGSVVPNSESVEVLAMAPQVEGEAFGPDNTEQDIVDTSIGSVASPLNEAASALEQIEQKESHGPDNTERDIVDAPIVHVAGTLNAAALALEVKKQEELHEPDSGNALLGVENIPTASVVLNSDSVDVSALAPKEDSEASGLGNTEQGIIDTSVAGHLNAEASTFEPNEQEESHGPNNGNGVLGAHDMPTVSVVLNSDLADASTLARKEDEEAGPGDIEQDAVDVSTASVAGPHNPAASALEPKTQEESQGNDTARAFTAELHNEETFRGPGGGHADNDTVSDVASKEEENSQCPSDGKGQIEAGDNHTISQLCSNTLAGAVLNEKNDCQGHGNTEHNMVDASSASVAGPYDIGVSILESKERNESHGPRNAEYNAGDASSASVGGPCISAASTLELKDQEESHGPANRNDDLVARDDQTTSVVPNSDSAEVSALAPKREEDTRGVDDYNVQLDTPGPPSSVMVGHDTAAVLDPEPQEEVLHGTGSGPCEDNVSPMQLKEEGNGANGKAEDDAGDDQTTSRMVGSDALAESTSESIGNND